MKFRVKRQVNGDVVIEAAGNLPNRKALARTSERLAADTLGARGINIPAVAFGRLKRHIVIQRREAIGAITDDGGENVNV